MNHDATHCADYNSKQCPKECYRAELTKELREIYYPLPTSWAHFNGTKECLKKKEVLPMTENEQIQEMAETIICKAEQLPRCPHTTCSACKATELYNKGYRKVERGEWKIMKMGDGERVRTCSSCLISQSVNVYKGEVMFRYCPYCGADMKNKEVVTNDGD